MSVYLLIMLLSVVQSLFGVGLLLFGTPFLLLLGHEYSEALLYLLPASAALSWAQVRDLKKVRLNGSYRKNFFLLCLPALIAGMMLSARFDVKWEIRLLVTVMLLIAFLLRTSSSLRETLQGVMKKNLKSALTFMGLIHGLSNMGGSILTSLASGLYQDKEKVLAAVSFDYAFMASLQLVFLVLISGHSFELKYLWGPVISLLIRSLIGERLFTFTTETNYQRLLNGFILANAILLGINL
jgi:uncharacterized membrane protein YfcA